MQPVKKCASNVVRRGSRMDAAMASECKELHPVKRTEKLIRRSLQLDAPAAPSGGHGR